VWHVAEWHRVHTVFPATHTFIHEWNEPSCMHFESIHQMASPEQGGAHLYQILLPRYLMNGLNSFDKTDRVYSLASTDDLIIFWRSKVKGHGHTFKYVVALRRHPRRCWDIEVPFSGLFSRRVAYLYIWHIHKIVNLFIIVIVFTGPPTHSVGGQTSNGRWCLSSSVVCWSL